MLNLEIRLTSQFLCEDHAGLSEVLYLEFNGLTSNKCFTEEDRESMSWTMAESKARRKGTRVRGLVITFRGRPCRFATDTVDETSMYRVWTQCTSRYAQIIAFVNESGLLNVNKICFLIIYRCLTFSILRKLKVFPSIVIRWPSMEFSFISILTLFYTVFCSWRYNHWQVKYKKGK